MEIRIEISVLPSGIYQRISENRDEWSPFAKVSPAVIMDTVKAAQHRVEPTFDNVGEKPTVSKSYPNELTK